MKLLRSVQSYLVEENGDIIMTNKYSENIMRDVRQSLGCDELDTTHDEEIMKMAKQDVFNKYCEWNGLLGGYGYDLLNVIENIYDINLQQ